MAEWDDNEPDVEFDGPWKEAIEWFVEPFFQQFFLAVHAIIDWSRGYEFLDKELESLHRESSTGRGTVDKLVQVWLRDGTEQRILIHIEVQSQATSDFSERMYTYNHRLRDRYGRMPISLAILGDDRPTWRPTEFSEHVAGCGVRFQFLTAKLLEWSDRDAELEQCPNPFAPIIRAHLRTLNTRGNPEERGLQKWAMIRGLYERGLDRERIIRLSHLIDWMMTLSPPRQLAFEQTVIKYEEGLKVPFVSVHEKIAIEKGKLEGKLETLQTSIESILDVRFGSLGNALVPRVRTMTDIPTLEQLQRFVITADLAAIEQRLPTEST